MGAGTSATLPWNRAARSDLPFRMRIGQPPETPSRVLRKVLDTEVPDRVGHRWFGRLETVGEAAPLPPGVLPIAVCDSLRETPRSLHIQERGMSTPNTPAEGGLPPDPRVEAVAPPPEMLDDRYAIEGLVGRGATAEVYRAEDRRLGRPVAVKFFRPGVTDLQRHREDRELQALARLDHPNLVVLLDAGAVQGRSYLVMELVCGSSLREILDGGILTTGQVAALGAQVADALAYAHQHGITHRDIKPGNILIGENGATLGDFGLAHLIDATNVTDTGSALGTPRYMAPEQVCGEPTGPAADVYALGLVLLEAITGREEYPGPKVEAALARLHRPPSVPQNLPASMATVLLGMLAQEPDERTDTAACAAALHEAAELMGSAAPSAPAVHAVRQDHLDGSPSATPSSSGGPVSETGQAPQSAFRPPPAPTKGPQSSGRHARAVLIGVVAALLLLAGGLGAIVLSPGSTPEPVAPSGPPAASQPGGDRGQPATDAEDSTAPDPSTERGSGPDGGGGLPRGETGGGTSSGGGPADSLNDGSVGPPSGTPSQGSPNGAAGDRGSPSGIPSTPTEVPR